MGCGGEQELQILDSPRRLEPFVYRIDIQKKVVICKESVVSAVYVKQT
jgi:hypothetical protein